MKVNSLDSINYSSLMQREIKIWYRLGGFYVLVQKEVFFVCFDFLTHQNEVYTIQSMLFLRDR